MSIKRKLKKLWELIKNTYLCIYYHYFPVKTAMCQGIKLQIDTASLKKIEKGYGDWLIHPCVRYIPNGFAGHKWWMVCTPYPNFDSHYENPVLYYGEGNEKTPPVKWHFVALVQTPHKEGYNADCNLYYDDNKLLITWKEAGTPNTTENEGYKVTMGCYYDGNTFSSPQIICKNIDNTNMYLASQVLVEIKQNLKLLAVFTPNSYQPIPNKKKGPRHIASFGIDKWTKEFKFEGVKFQNYPNNFDFWHIDIFTYKEKYYCLVTPESADKILLGESTDGLHYIFFKTPLLHEHGRERTPYTYKVSGLVVEDIFYLFYPMRMKEKGMVQLHVTSIDFNKLLYKLKQQ
ncbi:MAG: hypothetical protein NC388_07500 [Clostridium sp.]|nr:hypothetical protein [Clostridium sp.]